MKKIETKYTSILPAKEAQVTYIFISMFLELFVSCIAAFPLKSEAGSDFLADGFALFLRNYQNVSSKTIYNA